MTFFTFLWVPLPAWVQIIVGSLAFGLFRLLEIATRPWLDMILLNPAEAVYHANQVHDQFTSCLVTEGPKTTVDANETKRYVQSAHDAFIPQCPFFTLGECVKEDFWPCVLSRDHDPKIRHRLEVRAVDYMHEIWTARPTTTLQYAGFACGGAFQDLVIATKFLSKNPTARVHFHLIDVKFTPFAFTRDLQKDDRDIELSKSTTVGDMVLVDLKQKAIQSWGANAAYFQKPETVESLKLCAFDAEVRYKPFLGFLKDTFPQANIRLSLHAQAEDYLSYLNGKEYAPADLIVATDIQDEMSLLRGSVSDFNCLFQGVFEKNNQCKGLLLSKTLKVRDSGSHAWCVDIVEAMQVTENKGKKETQISVHHIGMY